MVYSCFVKSTKEGNHSIFYQRNGTKRVNDRHFNMFLGGSGRCVSGSDEEYQTDKEDLKIF